MRLRVLILEDNPDDAVLIERTLRRGGFAAEITAVASEQAFVSHLASPPDLILADFNLGSWTAHRALDILRERKLDIPTIIVTGTIGDAAAVECLKRGAYDYVLKNQLERLPAAAKGAIERRVLHLERQAAEQALRESERRFRETLENVRLVAVALDLSGNVIFCNKYLLEMTGYSSEEVLGNSWFDEFIEPGDETREIWHETVGAGSPCPTHHENPILTRTGERRLIAWNNTDLKNADGQITGVVSIGEDVTDLRRATDSLTRQAALLDLVPDAVYVTDLDRRLQFWSAGAERVYGWKADEILGRDRIELCAEKPGPDQTDPVRRGLNEKGEWAGEQKHVRKDGRPIDVHCRALFLRDESGKPTAVLSVSTDVTERKVLEAQLLRSQRLESIGTLAGGIAHDLNNVLQPIMMAIGMLGLRHRDEESHRLLEMLETSTKRGAAIVKQVLTFARGVQGDRVLLQPKHVIREVANMLGDSLPKSIRLITDVPKDLWTISADATLLHQVLMNICINARDAMPNGGALTIAAANVAVDPAVAATYSGARPGPHVLISASDTGTGIAPEILDRIFEPFFTTKEVGKGTGLGLSTVHSIVRSHGGFVQVDSHLGKGTQFRVYIPACEVTDAELAEQVQQKAVSPIGHGELILLVDDEAAVREIAKATLEAHNYRVITAGDGTEAILQFADHKDEIALVVTDMAMPYLDGAGLIRALHKTAPELKILCASGGARPGVDCSPAEGAQRCLSKPFTAEALLRTVYEVIHGLDQKA